MTTDEQLLETLHEVLTAPAVEPSHNEVAALYQLVDAQGATMPLPTVVPPVGARRFHRPRRPAALVAVGLASVLALSGVAVAMRASLPRPVRQLASTIGLPVDAPELTDAKHAMSQLRAALNSTDDDALRAARDQLVRRLAALDASDRASIAHEARALIARADERLAEQTRPSAPTTPTTPAAPAGSPTTVPATPTTSDDHSSPGPGGSGSDDSGDSGSSDTVPGSDSSGPGSDSSGSSGSGSDDGGDSSVPGEDDSSGSSGSSDSSGSDSSGSGSGHD